MGAASSSDESTADSEGGGRTFFLSSPALVLYLVVGIVFVAFGRHSQRRSDLSQLAESRCHRVTRCVEAARSVSDSCFESSVYVFASPHRGPKLVGQRDWQNYHACLVTGMKSKGEDYSPPEEGEVRGILE